jgi:colanic acid/amylovoran biosynthesis protein
MKKILIINSYTWFEKGDAAIIIGMLYTLRQQFPDAEITLLTKNPEVDRQHFQKYDARLRVFKNLLVVPPNYSKLAKAFTYLWGVIKHACLAVFRAPKALYDDTLKTYADADMILSCGGGYIGGYYIIGLLVQLYRIYLGKLLKKPVALFCVSVEPCGNIILEKAVRFVLNKVDLIIVREELSQNYLQRLGVKTPVYLGADAAFILPDYLSPEADNPLAKEGIHKKAGELLVGVSVRDWSFPQYRGQAGKSQADNYFSAMVEAVRHLTSELGARVVFFPMVIYYPNDDDRMISQKIADAVGNDQVTVLTGDYTHEELEAIMESMDLLISARLHAAIFAACMGVPTLGIASEPNKFNGILGMLGVGEYVLPIEDLTVGDIIAKIDSLLGKKDEIRETLLRNAFRIKSLVVSSAQLLRREIG